MTCPNLTTARALVIKAFGLITVKHAYGLLGVSAPTLYAMRDTGGAGSAALLPVVRLGRSLYDRKEVEWIAALMATGVKLPAAIALLEEYRTAAMPGFVTAAEWQDLARRKARLEEVGSFLRENSAPKLQIEHLINAALAEIAHRNEEATDAVDAAAREAGAALEAFAEAKQWAAGLEAKAQAAAPGPLTAAAHVAAANAGRVASLAADDVIAALEAFATAADALQDATDHAQAVTRATRGLTREQRAEFKAIEFDGANAAEQAFETQPRLVLMAMKAGALGVEGDKTEKLAVAG